MKVVVINSCIRGEESRTKLLLDFALENLNRSHEVEIIDLNEIDLPLVNNKYFNNRLVNGTEERFIQYSNKIASSDMVLIASPFWDMGIPAMLKCFLEHLSIFNIMFIEEDNTCKGIANCKRMVFLTTRGMNIETWSELDQASPYLKALCSLWGIDEFYSVGVSNLDYIDQKSIDKKIDASKIEIEKLLNKFN